MEIPWNYVGSYADVAAIWVAFPNGGTEGDYATIGGVEYRWNKYDRIWENAATVTEGTARRVDTFDGDVNIQNNLTVAGYIRAKGIKQPCVGLFASLDALEFKWPEPEVGMWAAVGDTFPADVYRCNTEEDGWEPTGETVSIDGLEFNIANGIASWVPISSTSQLPSDPTPEQQGRGYLLGTMLYVYVGIGGDTLSGKYQSAQLKGLKGDKGDKGDNAVVLPGEYSAYIADNLDTDDGEKILSARQGYKLKEMVDISMTTEGKEVINLADLSGKVTGVYEGGTLVTAGFWPGSSSSIKVAVEPNTAYLIGSAFYGGSIPRYIGEWDENGDWLRDAVANNVGIEGSEYTQLKNNLAYIKTSADAHFISIAFLTSAYSASDLAPTMVIKADRVVMPSEYVAYGVRDNGAMATNSIDSFGKTELSIPLSQLSKECFAEKMQAAEFSNASTSYCRVRLYANLPRMLASPLGRALTTGDVVELRFDAKIDNYSGGSVQGYTEIMATRQGTSTADALDSKSERTNTFNGDWGSKSMSLTITGTSTPNKVLYIQYTLNFYNVLSGTMLFKNIKVYVNDTYCFDFDSAMGDTPAGNVGQTKDVIADERGIIATKSYVDAKTSTAGNWYLGKKWLAFGDSITAPSHSYAVVTAEELGMTCENAGVSGYTSGNVLNQVLPLYQDTLATYDVISVQIGTNDFATNVPIATFKSNLSSIFNTILTNTYGKVYVAGTPIRRGDLTTNTLGLTLTDYVDAFIEVQKEYGFQLLDQYHNGVTHFDLSNWWTSGLVSPSDKLHPTASGQLLIAQQWKAFLTSIR